MIDHVVLNVRDLDASAAFYTKALEPLGFVAGPSFPNFLGFSLHGKPEFWIARRGESAREVHVALRAERRAVVDAFHAAALAAGGTCNGAPGLREAYHPSYYGAFVLDPDGNNVEAVCHAPE